MNPTSRADGIRLHNFWELALLLSNFDVLNPPGKKTHNADSTQNPSQQKRECKRNVLIIFLVVLILLSLCGRSQKDTWGTNVPTYSNSEFPASNL